MLTCFFLSCCLSSCVPQQHPSVSGNTIHIAGSTTVQPISEVLGSLYHDEHKDINIEHLGIGSGQGLELLASGKADLGASSRDLTSAERDKLTATAIAHDAIAIIVNTDNHINNISLEDLRLVLAGEITNWKELGGDDRIIQVVNLERGAGSRAMIEDMVMCPSKKTCKKISQETVVLNTNTEAKRAVEIVKGAIAYISYGFLDGKVKALSIDGKQLTKNNISIDTYPLVRKLYYVERKDLSSYGRDDIQKKRIAEFLDFVLSPAAQDALVREGFLPITNSAP